MMTFHLWNERLILPRKRFPPQKKCSLEEHNCVQLICFYLPSVVMELQDCRDLLCFIYSLHLVFVSLILTYLYPYVFLWSKFNERKSLPWLACVVRAELLKWTISSSWWKEINSCLTMTIDLNESMLIKKIITHRKGHSKFGKWAKTKLYVRDRDRDWPV